MTRLLCACGETFESFRNETNYFLCPSCTDRYDEGTLGRAPCWLPPEHFLAPHCSGVSREKLDRNLEICRRFASGERATALANEFGISTAWVYELHTRYRLRAVS